MSDSSIEFVAELSGNHGGDLKRALLLIDSAKQAGATAVKFQTFNPDQMAGADTIIKDGPWRGMNLLDLYRKTQTPREWHAELFAYAKAVGIRAFSSVFHPDDVDFLETLDCPRYKIASFEATDLTLIKHAASTGKPMVISMGMCTFEEIEAAVDTARKHGCLDLTVLKCTSAYPAPNAELNLRTVEAIMFELNVRAGLSDHTIGEWAAMVAIAKGAEMIEKHLKLAGDTTSPDAEFSATPAEFLRMVVAGQAAEEMLGAVKYGPTESEHASMALRRQPGKKRGEA